MCTGAVCAELRQRSCLQSALLPHVHVGSGDGPGCFTHLKGVYINKGQLFWWEALMTFVLVRHIIRPMRAAICSALRARGVQPCSLQRNRLPQGDHIMAMWTGSSSKPTIQLPEVGSSAADVPWQMTIMSNQLCSQPLCHVPACPAEQASATHSLQ